MYFIDTINMVLKVPSLINIYSTKYIEVNKIKIHAQEHQRTAQKKRRSRTWKMKNEIDIIRHREKSGRALEPHKQQGTEIFHGHHDDEVKGICHHDSTTSTRS